MSDWWARKLGGGGGGARPAQPAPQQQQYRAPARDAWAQTHQPSQQPVFDPNDPLAAMSQWRGGEGTRKETARCPHCGGDKFFSQQNTNPLGGGGGGAGARIITQNGTATTAPRCFECGYTTHHGMQTGAM